MDRGKELVKNTIIIFLGKFATQFLSFFLLPIYTKFLDTGDYGTVDLILTYVSLLVPIITIQQEMATFRFLIDYRNNEKKISEIINTSIRNELICVILFIFLYIIIINFIDLKYGLLIMINIIICVFSNLLLQISRGLGKNINYSIASFITGFVTFFLNIVLICFLGFGAKGILISMIMGNAVCIAYLILSLRLFRFISKNNINKDLSKSMFKYSLPLVPNGISWWFISVSDRTIITFVLGVAANGIYAVANKFPSIITSLLNIFNLSWSESTSLHINDKDRDVFFSNVAETILRIFSCFCLALIVILPFLYDVLIGKNYIDSYNYIPIFLVGTLCNCIICVYSAIYIGLKMTKKVASTSIMAAIINIVLNILFIKKLGLYAASLSTSISYFLMMIYRHYDIKKYIKIKYDNKLVAMTIIAFCISMYFYYINSFYLNIFNFIIIMCYCFVLNKRFIFQAFMAVTQKLRKSHNL